MARQTPSHLIQATTTVPIYKKRISHLRMSIRPLEKRNHTIEICYCEIVIEFRAQKIGFTTGRAPLPLLRLTTTPSTTKKIRQHFIKTIISSMNMRWTVKGRGGKI